MSHLKESNLHSHRMGRGSLFGKIPKQLQREILFTLSSPNDVVWQLIASSGSAPCSVWTWTPTCRIFLRGKIQIMGRGPLTAATSRIGLLQDAVLPYNSFFNTSTFATRICISSCIYTCIYFSFISSSVGWNMFRMRNKRVQSPWVVKRTQNKRRKRVIQREKIITMKLLFCFFINDLNLFPPLHPNRHHVLYFAFCNMEISTDTQRSNFVIWREVSSGIWRSAIWYTFRDVSEESTVSIFGVKEDAKRATCKKLRVRQN